MNTNHATVTTNSRNSTEVLPLFPCLPAEHAVYGRISPEEGDFLIELTSALLFFICMVIPRNPKLWTTLTWNIHTSRYAYNYSFIRHRKLGKLIKTRSDMVHLT